MIVMRSAPFQIQLKAKSKGRKRLFEFRSARGVETPENVRPEEVLLLQGIDVKNTSAVLDIDSRIGVVGCVLGDQARAGRVLMTESEARSSLVSELNRRRNEISSAEVMLSSDLSTDCLRKYDVATYVPKSSDPDHVVRQKVFEAVGNLRDDSEFYFSSDKDTVEKFREFIEQFGDVSEKVKEECKLLEVEKPAQPRNKGFLQDKMIEHSIKGVNCKFRVLKDYFSGEEMNAVEMLSRELEPEEGERVLDLSSGFGGVGIFSAKLHDVLPTFVDRNAYMKDLVEENCDRNDVENYDVHTEDGAENLETASFDKVAYKVDPDQDQDVVEQDLWECRRILKAGGEIFVCHSRDFEAEKMMNKLYGEAQTRRREVDHQISVSIK